MKSISCEKNNRQRSDCKFNVDCNNFKYENYDYVKPLCPANIDNLPSCDNNNKSKRCSTLLCNFEKHKTENEKLNNRNIPFSSILPVEPYRSSFNVCNTYTDLNSSDKNIIKSDIGSNSINKNIIEEENNNIFRKKNATSFYDYNIDVDSKFKYPPFNTYITNNNSNNNFNDPTVLKDKLAEDINLHNLDKLPPKPISNKVKCSNHTDDKQYICTNQVNTNYTSSLLTFDYPDFNKPCSTGCLPQHHTKLPKHIPPSYNSNMNINSIGPERINHEYENLWNNVTRRKHIS